MRIIKLILSLAIVLALLLTNTIYASTQTASANELDIELPPLELPEKGNPKLDSHLNRLVMQMASDRSSSFDHGSTLESAGESVRVIVECISGEVDAVEKVAGDIGVVEARYSKLLQVTVSASHLAALADNPNVHLVRIPMEPIFTAITSEGVALLNADDWHAAGYNGAGVKIAILDGGFSGYSTRQSEGELPASVTTWWAPSVGNEGTSVHGTGCAEIVYDIAPAAQFYLANFGTSVELGNAVDWLIAQGVDIISASWGYPVGGPGDGTGPITSIVDTARAAGILWVSAIGNSAQRHWQGNFSNPDGDSWHNFSGTDELNDITVSSGDTIIAALKWDDTWGSSNNDYDLLLYDSTLTTPVAGSARIQDGDDDPVEIFGYTATNSSTYYLAIGTLGNPAVVNFHLYSYSHSLQYQTASSSFGIPADSPDAMAVGAVNYGTPTTLEPFSSRGPTKDGRVKPDLVAPDGVSTVTYGASAFSGTSASAPHAAGAAALVKDRYSSYTPTQIQSFIEGRAVDLGDAGKDNLYGSGRLDLGFPPLTVTTSSASNITAHSALLNGNLDSLGYYSSVNTSYEWGSVSGNLTNETSREVMTSEGSFGANLSALASNTTYYFRAKAVVDGITVSGNELSFTTLPPTPPAVTTNSVTNIGTNIATLHGNLDSLGSASEVELSFEWGTSSGSYANETPPLLAQELTPFSFNMMGLSANTTYYFRAKAVGDATGYGNELSFTTLTSGCFIATAAYGTDTAKEIQILRDFRDDVLLTNTLGAEFVSSYYEFSPPIADFIAQHEVIRTIVREGMVDPIVAIVNWSHNLWSKYL